MAKINVPVNTPVQPGSTNSNYSGEIAKINELISKTDRSNSGQIQWQSPTSGQSYDTSTYSSNTNIYNKGETGLYNLLLYLYGGTDGWILTASDYNTIKETVDSNNTTITNIMGGSSSVEVANKLGTTTVGSSTIPIYLAGGVPTACSSVGSSTNASYASHIGTSSSHPGIGSATQPVYVDSTGAVQPATAYASATVGNANKLTTARSLTAKLDSTTAASFDGSAAANIGVSGILPVANGGTGSASVAANKVFAGGASGTAAPSFRALVEADIPSLSASKIGSGTLSVSRGGTGASTLTSNGVVLGNGTSAVKVKASSSGAFYSTGSNAEPVFGTLPVAQGGTGQTSLSNVTVGSASTATSAGKWTTARTLSLTGAITGSGSWDGSGNLSIATTATNAILSGTTEPTSSTGKNGDIYIYYTTS